MATSKRFIAKNGLDNNSTSITNLGTSGSSLELSGANAVTFTTTGTTNVTLPTSGTLATTTALGAYVLKAGDTMTGALAVQPSSGTTAITTTGNVGIGTASPGQRLAVRSADNSGSTNIARFESNSAAQGVVIGFASVLGDGGNTSFGTLTNNPVLFAVSNNEIARFDTNGRFGIGRSPGTLLDVQSGGASIIRVRGSTGTAEGSAVYGTVGSDTTRWAIGSDATIYGGTPGDNSSIYTLGTLSLGSNGVRQMYIDLNGNLGIGVSSPSSYGKLTVWGGNVYVQSTTAGVGSKITLSDTNNLVSVESSPVGAASDMIFRTSAATQMTLNNVGNLGLGVTPSAWGSGWKSFTNQLYGEFYSTNGGYVGLAANAYYNGTNWIYKNTTFAVRYEQDLTASSHKWFTAASGTADNTISFTQAMTLDGSGNLGIGTSSPSAKLHLSGTGTQALWVSSLTSGDVGLSLRAEGVNAGGLAFRRSSGMLAVTVGADDVANFTPAGSLGIGTTSPLSKFEVNSGFITAGSTTSVNGSKILAGHYSSGAITTLGSSFSSGAPVLGYGVWPSTTAENTFVSATNVNVARGAYVISGNQHIWYRGATQTVSVDSAVTMTESMRIDSSGNVGIGAVSSRAARLAVVAPNVTLASTTTNLYVRTSNAQAADVGGSMAFGGFVDDAASAEAPFAYIAGRKENSISGNYAGYLQFGVTDGGAGTNEAMRITSAGNVGIGKIPDGEKFGVRGGYSVFMDNSGNFLTITPAASVIFNASTSMQFNTGGNNRLQITGSGDVGIGTSSPAVKFVVSNGGAAGLEINPNGGVNGGTSAVSYNRSAGAYVDATNYALTHRWWVGNAGNSMILDADGRLGVGTTTATSKVDVVGGDGDGIQYRTGTRTIGIGQVSSEAAVYWGSGSALTFFSGSERMRVDSSGNLLAGISTQIYPATNRRTIEVNGTSQALFGLGIGGTAAGYLLHDGTDLSLVQTRAGALAFGTNNTERMRIGTGGDVLIGTATNPSNFKAVIQHNGAAENGLRIIDIGTTGTPNNLLIDYSSRSPNNTANNAILFTDSSAVRFGVYANGGIANYQANNVNLSDRREKTNFAPARDYLDVICSIPVQTFNYIDQPEDDPGTTLGVVAQDVQAVAPELVRETNWGTAEDPKMRLSVYQTDLQYALMKCIQEQQAIIESLRTRIDALEKK